MTIHSVAQLHGLRATRSEHALFVYPVCSMRTQLTQIATFKRQATEEEITEGAKAMAEKFT